MCNINVVMAFLVIIYFFCFEDVYFCIVVFLLFLSKNKHLYVYWSLYIKSLLTNLSGWVGLHSAECGDLAMSRTATELGKQSFFVAVLVIWNSIPEHLHSSSVSKRLFRRGLKTHLCQQAYILWEPWIELNCSCRDIDNVTEWDTFGL